MIMIITVEIIVDQNVVEVIVDQDEVPVVIEIDEDHDQG